VERVELLPVQLGLDEVLGQVLARIGHVVADLVQQVVEEQAHPLDALIRRCVDALQRVLDEHPELGAVLEREAEHPADDAHRDVLRVLGGGVDILAVAERVDQRVAVRPGGRLQLGHRRLGEGRQEQLAGVVVERRVGRDRR
jgi:hypothetical protein